MKKLTDVDKNFLIETNIKRNNLKLYDVEEAPFSVHGLMRENGKFSRMPEEVAKSVNEGVLLMHDKTAGGRVRFVTDSPYVAISVKMNGIMSMEHFPFTGSAGFDLYADEGEGQVYKGTYMPPFSMKDGYESVMDFPEAKKRLITINFPLYSGVDKLYIGLDENALLEAAPEYTYSVPVVYYGSSITQGGCASRPGNAYQAIISRLLDCDFINLGFSGSARGEDTMTDYINTLNMSAFVMDYDYNAPTPEHLEATHEPMFRKIRKAHPDLPILLLTRPKVHLDEQEKRRVEIVEKTYQDAIAAGDEHVYFIKGSDLIKPEVIETATVDNCHPNDSGFVSMAYTLCEVMKGLL